MGLVHFKREQGTGRGGKVITRAQSAINSISAKVERVADRYRAARLVLVALNPAAFKQATREDPTVGAWVKVYQELQSGDILNPRGEDPGAAPPVTAVERQKAALGEGHKTISWIWITVRYTASDHLHPARTSDEEAIEGKPAILSLKRDSADSFDGDLTYLAMRSTYARVRARWLRWKEEVQLLQEEMRRAPVFLLWKANWWKERADSRPDASSGLRSGLCAYALRQSQLFTDMATRLVRQWAAVAAKNSLTVEWSTELKELAFKDLPECSMAHDGAPQVMATADTRLNVPVTIEELNKEMQNNEDSGTEEEDIEAGGSSNGYESGF